MKGYSINRLIDKSKNSRKGFTVLELLVASLLLGMLMTILTMIFNQSSIAWKTGEASVEALRDAGDGSYRKISDIRYKADNVYMWDGTPYYIHCVFGSDGDVLDNHNKYISSQFEFGKGDSSGITLAEYAKSGDTTKSYNASPEDCGGGGGKKSVDDFVVNVRSFGPDRTEERYDNIYGVSPIQDTSEW